MKLYKAQGKAIMIGIIVLLGMLIISLSSVSALELNPFADSKNFDKSIKADISDYIKANFNSKYGVITINSNFMWVNSGKIAEYSLTKNTEYCLISCEAEGKVTLYKEGVLFDNVKFKTLKGDDTSIKSSEYLIFNGYKDNYLSVPDTYKEICVYNELAKNQSCSQVVTAYKKVNQPIEVWNKYNGETLKVGDYRWKIKGIKEQSQSIDFIPIRNNKEFSEWATWQSSMNIGLVNYWNFDEGTGAIAYGSNGISNFTAGGGASWTSKGKLSNAINLTTNGQYYSSPDSVLWEFPNTKNISISFWINTTYGNNLIVLDKDGNAGWSIQTFEGKICINAGNILTGCSASMTSYAGVYVYVVFNILDENDGNVVNVYVNGALSGTGTSGGRTYSTGVLSLGQRQNPSTYQGFIGYLDELGIWNRSLTTSELTDLYNGGTGITYTNTFGNISIENSVPKNNLFINYSLLNLSCNATSSGGINITSVMLNATGALTWTSTIGGLNKSFYNAIFESPALSDGLYRWNCVAYGSNGINTSSTIWNFTKETIQPNINVSYPSGLFSYLKLGQNLTLNYTINDTNIGSCWYDYGQGNKAIPCNVNSSFNVTARNNLTIYANDTSGNTASLNINWTYIIFENKIAYNTPVITSQINNITGNFSFMTAPSQFLLIYNNTNSTPTISSNGLEYFLTSNVLAPVVSLNTNISLYYNFIIGGSSYNSSSNNQTITGIYLTSNCLGNFTFLNISNYDEETLNLLNGTVEYLLSLESSNSQLTQLYGNVTGTKINICSSQNLSGTYINYNLQLRYYTSGYFYKAYNIQNNQINNIPIALDLLYLNNTIGSQFKINYVDFNYITHPNAIIQIQRQYLSNNSYRIVEIPKLDSNGLTTGSFNTNNIRYKIIVIDNGVIIDAFDNTFPVCQNLVLGTCELNLRGAESTSSSTSGDFSYTLTKTNSSITLTYIIPSGTPRDIEFITDQQSRFLNNISNCDTTIYSSGGTITCNYNATVGDSIISTRIINSDGTSLYGQVLIAEDLSSYFLLNNYFIAFILLLTLGLMFISSGVMLIISGIAGLVFLGLIFLIKGMDFTTLAGSLGWLVVGAVILIYKISQKEDRT